MGELEFFTTAEPLSLAAVAALVGVPLPPGPDPQRLISGVATLDRAGPKDATMVSGAEDVTDLRATRAGLCLVTEDRAGDVPDGTVALVADRPVEAFRKLVTRLYPGGGVLGLSPRGTGIDASAIVHPDARLEAGVTIEAGVVIGRGAEVGAGTRIGANSILGEGVRVGRGCVIDSHVNLRAALIGDRVVVHAGAKIGVGGLLAPDPSSRPRVGRVIVQDRVEIGANAVVERGALGDTVIGEEARIGTLVVVAGETVLDRHALIERSAFPDL